MKKRYRSTEMTETELNALATMIQNGEKDKALGFIDSKIMQCARSIYILKYEWGKD